MSHSKWSVLVTTWVLIVANQSAYGFIQTVSPGGVPIHWDGNKLNLVGNPKSSSGLSADSFRNAIVRGLQSWKDASGGAVRFDYWQGEDSGVYQPNSERNDYSSIYFLSNRQGGGGASTDGVIALTEVWYQAESGLIIETDTVFNDLQYKFSDDVRDAVGYGAGTTSGKIYIGNVITHELGHSYGLSHSGMLQSSMFYLEAPEQANPACDDIAGIRTVTPSADRGSLGEIKGRVTAPNGSAIFGAHVIAISASRGVALGAALTQGDGRFAIQSLDEGGYYLMVEPYGPGAAALSPFFQNINTSVCSGGAFSRSFLTRGSNLLQGVEVSAGDAVDVGDFAVSCGVAGRARVNGPSGGTQNSNAPSITVGAEGQVGWADHFANSASAESRVYRLKDLSGKIRISALSYSLFSSAKVGIELLDENGSVLKTSVTAPVFSGDSGFINYDVLLEANVPRNDYFLRVNLLERISSTRYPAGWKFRDEESFFVLAINGAADREIDGSVFPVNGRCQLQDPSLAYRSPDGDPEKSEDPGGGCGTIMDSGGAPRGPTDGSRVVSGLLPWIFMFGVLVRERRRLRQKQWIGNLNA